MQLEYEIKYDKKNKGFIVTDKPEIYDIPPIETYAYPEWFIYTWTFGNAQAVEYENKIIEDIKNLFLIQKFIIWKLFVLFVKQLILECILE